MLKGNLVVGQNQSVVVEADSLRDLFTLASSKGQGTLRVDLSAGSEGLDNLLIDTQPGTQPSVDAQALVQTGAGAPELRYVYGAAD